MASLRRDHGYACMDDSQIASQTQSQTQSQTPQSTSQDRRPASHSHTSPSHPSPTSYTLSTKRQHHQVRIQGRLMLVKSVSANFAVKDQEDPRDPRDPRDAREGNDGTDGYYTQDTAGKIVSETELRDGQRRGYGIGGAGNIRRPTEVLHFYSTSNRTVADHDEPRQKRRWQWMNSLLGRKERSSYSYEKY